jgi:hypothetical protein
MNTIMPDMQCTAVPDLWLKPCCVEHDLGGSDLDFLLCVLIYTVLVAIIFSVMYWLGMIIGRPFYKRYQKIKENRNDSTE